VEDAVDLSTFPISAPYNRDPSWNEFVRQRREDVQWELGQIAEHSEYGYQVVIVAVDPGPVAADEAWLARMKVDELPLGRQQPFYWCLVDSRNRETPMMAYVPQERLRAVQGEDRLARMKGIEHPDLMVFFERSVPEPFLRGHNNDEYRFMMGVADKQKTSYDVRTAVEARYQFGAIWYPGKVKATREYKGRILHDILYQDGLSETNVTAARMRNKTTYETGDVIEALWKGGRVWYPGKIAKKLKNNCYNIDFDDGDKEGNVPVSGIRWFGSAERQRRAQGRDFLQSAAPHNGWRLRTSDA